MTLALTGFPFGWVGRCKALELVVAAIYELYSKYKFTQSTQSTQFAQFGQMDRGTDVHLPPKVFEHPSEGRKY